MYGKSNVFFLFPLVYIPFSAVLLVIPLSFFHLFEGNEQIFNSHPNKATIRAKVLQHQMKAFEIKRLSGKLWFLS